jgi:hypothetical protein
VVSTLVPKVLEEEAPLLSRFPRKLVKNDWRAAVDWPEDDAVDDDALDVVPPVPAPKSLINFVNAEFRVDRVPDDRFELEVLPLTTWLFDKSFTSDCSAEMMPPCPYWAATVLAVVAGVVLLAEVAPVAAVVLLAAAVSLAAVLPVVDAAAVVAVVAAAAAVAAMVAELAVLPAALVVLSPSVPPPPWSCRLAPRRAWNRSPRKDCRSCTTLLPFALLLEFAAAVLAVAAAVVPLLAVLAAVAVVAADDEDCVAAWVSACSRLANSAAPGCCGLLEEPACCELLEEPCWPSTARDEPLSRRWAERKLIWPAEVMLVVELKLLDMMSIPVGGQSPKCRRGAANL